MKRNLHFFTHLFSGILPCLLLGVMLLLGNQAYAQNYPTILHVTQNPPAFGGTYTTGSQLSVNYTVKRTTSCSSTSFYYGIYVSAQIYLISGGSYTPINSGVTVNSISFNVPTLNSNVTMPTVTYTLQTLPQSGSYRIVLHFHNVNGQFPNLPGCSAPMPQQCSIFENINVSVCTTPSNPIHNSLTANSAYIDWNPVASNNGYDIRYKTSSGSWIYTTSNTSNKTLTGLACNTAYEVQVRTNCSGSSSSWSQSDYFTTSACPCSMSLSAVPNPATCNNNNGSISMYPSGASSYQYSLNGGAWQSSSNFSNLAVGSYTCAVRDASNYSCGASTTTYVNNSGTLPSTPTNVQATDGTNCNGVDITWNGTADYWEIYANNINIGTSYSSSYFDGNASTNSTSYKVKAYDNTCGASSFSATNSGYKAAAPNLISITGNGTLSAGQTLNLSTTFISGATYTWTKDGNVISGATSNTYTLVNVSPSDAGLYEVYADLNGCTSNTVAKTVTVSVPVGPEISVDISGANIVDGSNFTYIPVVNVGSTATVTINITNVGTSSLTLSNPTGTLSEASIGTFSSLSVGAGGNATIILTLNPTSGGAKSTIISFANNDSDENPFNFTVDWTAFLPTFPEIAVNITGTNVVDGGTYPFATPVNIGATTNVTVTVENTGTAALTLSNATSASLEATINPMLSLFVAPNTTTTFVVQLMPTSAGAKTTVISFANNDADENPYDLTITWNSVVPVLVCTGCTGLKVNVLPIDGSDSIARMAVFEWEHELGRNIAYYEMRIYQETATPGTYSATATTINGNLVNTVNPTPTNHRVYFAINNTNDLAYLTGYKWKVTAFTTGGIPIACFEKTFRTMPTPTPLNENPSVDCPSACAGSSAPAAGISSYGTALGHIHNVACFKNGACHNGCYDKFCTFLASQYGYIYGWQCVELIIRHHQILFDMLVGGGNGRDYFNVTGNRTGFKQYINGTSTVMPQHDDIISFNNNGQYGHVGVVRDVVATGANTYLVHIAQQNIGNNQPFHTDMTLNMTQDAQGRFTIAYSSNISATCRGWIRATPTLISPGNDLTIPIIMTTTPTFEWEIHPNIHGYTLFIAEKDANNCYNLIIGGEISIKNNLFATATAPTLIPGHFYKWRVNAQYTATTSVNSDAFYFQVSPAATNTNPNSNTTVSGGAASSILIRTLASIVQGAKISINTNGTDWVFVDNTDEQGFIELKGDIFYGDSLKIEMPNHHVIKTIIDYNTLSTGVLYIPVPSLVVNAPKPSVEILNQTSLYATPNVSLKVKCGSNMTGYKIYEMEGVPALSYTPADSFITYNLANIGDNYLTFVFANATDTVMIHKKLSYIPVSMNAETYNLTVNNPQNNNWKMRVDADNAATLVGGTQVFRLHNESHEVVFQGYGLVTQRFNVDTTKTINLLQITRLSIDDSVTLNNFAIQPAQYAGNSMSVKTAYTGDLTVARVPVNLPLIYNPISLETYRLHKATQDNTPVVFEIVIDQTDNFVGNIPTVLIKRGTTYSQIYPYMFADSAIVFDAQNQVLKLLNLRGNEQVSLIQYTPPLPVELMNLAANAINNTYIQVSWETKSEANSKTFEVEASRGDAQHFTKIGELEAAGNSTTVRYYGLDDDFAQKGENFYRLKMVDLDGKYGYSDVVSAILNPTTEVCIYPNPADDMLYIETKETGNILVKISNALGQVVYQEYISNSQRIAVKSLANGIYNVEVRRDGELIAKQKLAIQH